MVFKITIHGTGMGPCALTGKESDGLTVTFEDGTIKDAFLSWKAFRQLLNLKTGQENNTSAKPPSNNTLEKVK
jgi:hypothetical protein